MIEGISFIWHDYGWVFCENQKICCSSWLCLPLEISNGRFQHVKIELRHYEVISNIEYLYCVIVQLKLLTTRVTAENGLQRQKSQLTTHMNGRVGRRRHCSSSSSSTGSVCKSMLCILRSECDRPWRGSCFHLSAKALKQSLPLPPPWSPPLSS